MIRQKQAHTLSDNTKSNTLINSVCIGNFSRMILGLPAGWYGGHKLP